jgi:hypothetical protein
MTSKILPSSLGLDYIKHTAGFRAWAKLRRLKSNPDPVSNHSVGNRWTDARARCFKLLLDNVVGLFTGAPVVRGALLGL